MFCPLVVLLLVTVANGQQAGHSLNNDDVIKRTHDGFDENVIVALVEPNPTDFDVSINGVNGRVYKPHRTNAGKMILH